MNYSTDKNEEFNDNDHFDLYYDDDYDRILTFVTTMEGKKYPKWVDLELIGPALYQVINRPKPDVVEYVLNKLVEETQAHRMGNVVLFPDEVRSMIKLKYGLTIRKH